MFNCLNSYLGYTKKYSCFVIIVTYGLLYDILNKPLHRLSDMNNSSSVVAVLLGVLILLSISLSTQLHLADARKKSSSETPLKQVTSQNLKCSSDAVCLAKAINILCTKDSLCYIGYNAPFLMTMPH